MSVKNMIKKLFCFGNKGRVDVDAINPHVPLLEPSPDQGARRNRRESDPVPIPGSGPPSPPLAVLTDEELHELFQAAALVDSDSDEHNYPPAGYNRQGVRGGYSTAP